MEIDAKPARPAEESTGHRAMPSLSARIGRETLLRYVEADARKEATEAQRDEIVAAVAAHLLQLVDMDIAVPHATLRNRRMNLLHHWNAMCGAAEPLYGTREDEARRVARRLAHPLVMVPLLMLSFDVARGMDEVAAAARLDALMAEMDTGTVSPWLMSIEEHDHVSGDQLDVALKNWGLVFGRRERDGTIEPAADIAPEALHVVEIDLPSGELLIADWFRMDGFTDMVDEGNPWRGGSTHENEADAERYLRDHGFVSVASARRSLALLRKGDRITMGRHDEDGDHPVPAGYRRDRDLTIDLRKVSIADRTALIETMSRIHPADQAARLVRDLMQERETIVLSVTPGRYRILSSGRGYIEDLLDDADPLKTAGYEPVLVVEPVPAGSRGDAAQTQTVV